MLLASSITRNLITASCCEDICALSGYEFFPCELNYLIFEAHEVLQHFYTCHGVTSTFFFFGEEVILHKIIQWMIIFQCINPEIYAYTEP